MKTNRITKRRELRKGVSNLSSSLPLSVQGRKNASSFTKVLTLSLAPLSLHADPDVAQDGWAHLVEVQSDGSVRFLAEEEIAAYPESGVIEVREEWSDFHNDTTHLDYATGATPYRVHMLAKGNHDMLIPLGRFIAGEVEVKYWGIDSNGFFAGTIVVGHRHGAVNTIDPAQCWVREHTGSSAWGREQVKLRVGPSTSGWNREYFLQLDRLWAPDHVFQGSTRTSTVSITIEGRQTRNDSLGRDTLFSAQNSVVPEPIFESFKTPDDSYTYQTLNGSQILTEATASTLFADDFVSQSALNPFLRSNQASFGTTPETTGVNNGINITSTNSTLGGASNRNLANSFLTLSDPHHGQHLRFDPNQIYANAGLVIESNSFVELRAPRVFTNDFEVNGDCTVEGTLRLNSVQGDIPMGIYGNE